MAADDLTEFAEVCRLFEQEVSIRGSTAYVLSKTADTDSVVQGSLVKSVPPLGDLDIIVRDQQPAEAMRRVGDVLERCRTYVPALRFIHVDVFYEGLPVRGDSPLGNVVIEGLPEVTIGDHGNWNPKSSSPGGEIRPRVDLRVPATLFRDFLFLLRLRQRYKEKNLEVATNEVATLLRQQSPHSLGLLTQGYGAVRELARIDKALVKHVLLRETDQEPTPMEKYLPRGWLSRFASYLNGLSTSIIWGEERWEGSRAIAYAVDGRVMRFAEVSDLDREEQMVLEAKLAPEAKASMLQLTPSLDVLLPNPDDPGCCEYRDFSKGIGELVWRDPDGGSLANVALMEGQEKYYAVHAQASEGFGARSLRTDPGYMGMVNHGSLEAVRLMGVRDDHAVLSPWNHVEQQ